MIGLTLKYKTLLEANPGSAEELFVNTYGGLAKALAALKDIGVDSIEISMLGFSQPIEEVLTIMDKIYSAGLKVTIHGVLKDLSSDTFLGHFEPAFNRIFSEQDKVSITLHGEADLELTKRVTEDWAKHTLNVWPGVYFAVENQRVKVEAYPHEKDHFRINAIPATLPLYSNIGICWDMGHYGYNVIKAGFPIETLPEPSTLACVRHTHIHGLKDMDTHHPVSEYPIRSYIDALKMFNYSGVYNLEVKPEKFISYMDVREGMETSIELIKSWVK